MCHAGPRHRGTDPRHCIHRGTLLLRYPCGLPQDLLDLPWPDAVLGWSSAAEVAGAEGRPMWRGVRVGIGIAWGGSTYRKPLNTGMPFLAFVGQ